MVHDYDLENFYVYETGLLPASLFFPTPLWVGKSMVTRVKPHITSPDGWCWLHLCIFITDFLWLCFTGIASNSISFSFASSRIHENSRATMASGCAPRLAYTSRPCGLDRSHYPIVIACIFIPVPIRRAGSRWPSNHDFDIDCIILQLDIWRDRGSGLLGKSLVRSIQPPSFNFLFLFFLRLCIYMLRRPGGRANGSFTLFSSWAFSLQYFSFHG